MPRLWSSLPPQFVFYAGAVDAFHVKQSSQQGGHVFLDQREHPGSLPPALTHPPLPSAPTALTALIQRVSLSCLRSHV